MKWSVVVLDAYWSFPSLPDVLCLRGRAFIGWFHVVWPRHNTICKQSSPWTSCWSCWSGRRFLSTLHLTWKVKPSQKASDPAHLVSWLCLYHDDLGPERLILIVERVAFDFCAFCPDQTRSLKRTFHLKYLDSCSPRTGVTLLFYCWQWPPPSFVVNLNCPYPIWRAHIISCRTSTSYTSPWYAARPVTSLDGWR